MLREAQPPSSRRGSQALADSRDKETEVRRLVAGLPGQRLPGEREWSAQLGISRPQLRAILAVLRREGIVEQRQGSGTYAVDPEAGKPRLRRVALLIDERLKFGDDPFFSYLLEQLQANLQAQGARCIIERVSSAAAASVRSPSAALQGEDGVITLGLIGETLLARHRAADPPLVALLLPPGARPGSRSSVFQLEDREGGRDAARLLIGDGCHDLLFVGRDDLPASAERYAGVKEIADDSEIALDFSFSGLNYAAGLRLGRTLFIADSDNPLGIIAANDWLAVGLRAGLQDRVIPLSRAARLVSFDGLPITADPALRITSFAAPLEAIAADAVAELYRLLRSGGGNGRTVRYPFCLPTASSVPAL